MNERVSLYNTLTHTKEELKPIHTGRVGLYTCGPTVYDYSHIGNFRYYIFADTLRRTLEYSGYKVMHVMNITDVGHLTSDEDSGEDKLEKGALREGKTVWDVAKFYTDAFLQDSKRLNILHPQKLIRATETIKEQIKIIEVLFKKGYAYETEQAVYFEVGKFEDYTKLSRQRLEEKLVGARENVVADPEKRAPADFALWFKRIGKFVDHTMHWSSPWGDGFPGWHIECSAISSSALGQPFDIHTGGVDHIAVHHTNEIAQSEAAFDAPLAKIWLHSEFLSVDGQKMSKSLGNFVTPQTIVNKRINILSFRYLVLTSHYRSKLNFTWRSLGAAEHSLLRLYGFITSLLEQKNKKGSPADIGYYEKKFSAVLRNDLDTPRAIAIIWELIGEYNKNPDRFNPKLVLKLLYDFDTVLGLDFKKIKLAKIPAAVKKLAQMREKYRTEQNWVEADAARAKIEAAGYAILDTPEGFYLRKKK